MANDGKPIEEVKYLKFILDCVQSNALLLFPELEYFYSFRRWKEGDEQLKKAHPAKKYVYITIDPMKVHRDRAFFPHKVSEHEIPVVILFAHSDFKVSTNELTSQTKLSPLVRAATLATVKDIQSQFHQLLRNTPYVVGIIRGTERVGAGLAEKYKKALEIYESPGGRSYERALFCSSTNKWRIEDSFARKERFVKDNRYFCFPQEMREVGKWNPGLGLASESAIHGIVRYALRARCAAGLPYASDTARDRPLGTDDEIVKEASADAFKAGIAYLLSLRAGKLFESIFLSANALNKVEASVRAIESAVNSAVNKLFTDLFSMDQLLSQEVTERELASIGLGKSVLDKVNREFYKLNPQPSDGMNVHGDNTYSRGIPFLLSSGAVLDQKITRIVKIIPAVKKLLSKTTDQGILEALARGIADQAALVAARKKLSLNIDPNPTSKDRLDVANGICHPFGGQSLFRGGRFKYETVFPHLVREFNRLHSHDVFDDNALGNIITRASIEKENEIARNKNPSTAENGLFAVMYAVAWRLNGDLGSEDDFKTKIKDLLIEYNKMPESEALTLAETVATNVTAADFPQVTALPALDYDPIMMIKKWDAPSLNDYNDPAAPFGTSQPINVTLEGLNIGANQIRGGDLFEFCDLWHADSGGRLVDTNAGYPQLMTFKVISAEPKGVSLLSSTYNLTIAPYPVPAGRTISCDRLPQKFVRIRTSADSKAKTQPNREMCVFAAPESLGLVSLPSWKGEGQETLKDPTWDHHFADLNDLRFELQEKYDARNDEMNFKVILKLGVGLLDPRSVVAFEPPPPASSGGGQQQT